MRYRPSSIPSLLVSYVLRVCSTGVQYTVSRARRSYIFIFQSTTKCLIEGMLRTGTVYRFEFRKLMCRLARSLKSADCRYLRYLYREESAHCAISPGEEGSALELLEALERACVVSSERPERVGEVMRELGREDCYHEVESFARKHAAVGMDIIGASPPSNAIVYTTRALAG